MSEPHSELVSILREALDDLRGCERDFSTGDKYDASIEEKMKPRYAALASLEEQLEALDAWASRMPDAGFNSDDPRWDWWHERPRLSNPANDSGPSLREQLETLREAISKASYALDPNQGESPDRVLAYQWLRTTFPSDHPNFVDRDTLSNPARRPSIYEGTPKPHGIRCWCDACLPASSPLCICTPGEGWGWEGRSPGLKGPYHDHDCPMFSTGQEAARAPASRPKEDT